MVSGLTLLVVAALATAWALGADAIRLIREPNAIAFSVEKGYGVQRNAKNELVFIDATSGKVLKTVKSFTGSVASEDKKYFNRLDPVALPKVDGKIRVTGRLFYCSFAEKFCSVQRIDQEL